MILIGIASILMFGKNQFYYLVVFLILQILLGFVTLMINVPVTPFYQTSISIDHQSRFFSLNSFLGKIAITLGTAYTGVIAQQFGAGVAYISNNICVILIVSIVFIRYRHYSAA